MEPANPLKIAEALSNCRYNVDMSQHARQRTVERSSVAPSRVLEIVTSRRTEMLPFRDANRSYHLLLDRAKIGFMIAVVAVEAGCKNNSANVVTVLTRKHFENDAGPIGKRLRVPQRAACSTPSKLVRPLGSPRRPANQFCRINA